MPTNPDNPPSHEAIAARAKEIWSAEGNPDGRHLDHWLQAEKELRGEAEPANSAKESPGRSNGDEALTAATGGSRRASGTVPGAGRQPAKAGGQLAAENRPAGTAKGARFFRKGE
jgi:hypothetical protein